MAYFFIYLLIIIVNIFAVLFVLKIRRNRLNDADVITDATLVEEDSIQQVRTKKSRSLFNKQDPSTNIFVEYEEIEEDVAEKVFDGQFLDIAVKEKIVKKKGNWYLYGEEKLGYGKDKAKFYLLENPDVASEIRSQLSIAIDIDNEINQNDLKKLNTKLYNLVIFKEQKINIDEDFPNATYMSLPLVYNELMTEVERLNKVTKINYKRYKLGKDFYNAKTSQLFEEKSSSVINLTELESKFLNYMLKKNGGATKTQILSEVWKHNKELDTHTLESLIYRLRKKIENNPNEPSVLINDSKRYFIKI